MSTKTILRRTPWLGRKLREKKKNELLPVGGCLLPGTTHFVLFSFRTLVVRKTKETTCTRLDCCNLLNVNLALHTKELSLHDMINLLRIACLVKYLLPLFLCEISKDIVLYCNVSQCLSFKMIVTRHEKNAFIFMKSTRVMRCNVTQIP